MIFNIHDVCKNMNDVNEVSFAYEMSDAKCFYIAQIKDTEDDEEEVDEEKEKENEAEAEKEGAEIINALKPDSNTELKPLPLHLKYVFLGSNETLPVIISSSLTCAQETRIIKLLQKYKNAIAWKIEDIRGISPAMCMHHIYLDKEIKPV